MKCPDCQAELKCPCPSPAHDDEPGIKWQHKEPYGVIGCPVCGFYAHMDYWEAITDSSTVPYENVPFQPKTHFLKIEPKYFYKIHTGAKTFELRLNDRGFKIGHCILFQMWTPERGYCNRSMAVEITYITDYPAGLQPGYVIMSIRRI